eukprot:TRINITY_DN10373_c0_g1_i1.p1 TRINITY_DN10373_c0_g1~~TRINITY_DN10373_c0_g1_i1.p1  ORF type:complete len:870 (-),score=127.66 TRINITY_DN10373_c0_g1_i1:359-2968(-)
MFNSTVEKTGVPGSLSRQNQVDLVMKLLSRNGEQSAIQIRNRAAKGEGVTAKGLQFNVSILKEALQNWDAEQNKSAKSIEHGGRTEHASDRTAAAATPLRKGCVSADGKSDSRGASGSKVGRRLARQLASKGGMKEHIDPHANASRCPPSCKAVGTGSEQPRADASCVRNGLAPAARAADLQSTSEAASNVPPFPAVPSLPSAAAEGLSVKELKSLLAASNVDCAGCVEKADLQKLWERFDILRQRPLSELQDYCQVDGGRRFENVDECAKYLLKCMPGRPSALSQVGQACWPQAAPGLAVPNTPAVQATESGVSRNQDVQREVHRILPLRKESFESLSSWGFAVLEVHPATREISVVQKAYRYMIRKLHPHRAGDRHVATTIERVREAKEACEQGCLQQELAPTRAPNQRAFVQQPRLTTAAEVGCMARRVRTAASGSPRVKRPKRKMSVREDETYDAEMTNNAKVARGPTRKPFANDSVDENTAPDISLARGCVHSGKSIAAGSDRPRVDAGDIPKRARAPDLPRTSNNPNTMKQVPAASQSSSLAAEGVSIKELKSLLAANGVDCSGCVEKTELQALWRRFNILRQRPPSEHCQVDGGRAFESMDEYAKCPSTCTPGKPSAHIASATSCQPQPAPAPAPNPAPAVPNSPAAKSTEVSTSRELDAQREVRRILPVRRESFKSFASWGFAVLGIPMTTCEVSVVQKAYRSMMRKLHPDRAGQDAKVAKAIETVHEAKVACERGLSRQELPPAPCCLRLEVLSLAPGQRRFRLRWSAPEQRACAPIQRYVIAAFDPAYGRALTIAMLEPDYSEELRSFVRIGDLTSYVLAEEDLQKMPKLWMQTSATVQVAAANSAGQSPWATFQVPLR